MKSISTTDFSEGDIRSIQLETSRNPAFITLQSYLDPQLSEKSQLLPRKQSPLPVSEGCDNQTATVPQILIAIDKLGIDCSDVQVSPRPVVPSDE